MCGGALALAGAMRCLGLAQNASKVFARSRLARLNVASQWYVQCELFLYREGNVELSARDLVYREIADSAGKGV